MAAITEDSALRIFANASQGEKSTLTGDEERQLAFSWLALDLLRRLVAEGKTESAIECLADPHKLSQAFYESRRVVPK